MPTTPAWTPPPAPHQTGIDNVTIPALGEVPPGPAAHFLAGPGRLAPGFHALLAGYAHALRDEGIPLDRSMVVMPTLHPLMGALNFIWSGSNNVVREILRSWAANNTDEFKNSPVARLWAGTHRVIRRHLCDPVSEAFVANCDEACLSLGEHHLKGVARAVKTFAPHSVR